MLHFMVEWCIKRHKASLTVAVALITTTWPCNWAVKNYQSTETGTHLISLSNNLNICNLFLPVSRSLIEFVAMDWILLHNVMAVGHQEVAAASSPMAPRETVQLWIVFKGQATLIFLHSSERKSLQFCKTSSQSEHARECVYVFAGSQDKGKIIHNGRVK